jgi:hypothetical protein
MSDTQTNRVQIAFKAVEDSHGRPLIAFILRGKGDQFPENDRLFTLDLASNMTTAEAAVLAQALNQCVTHLGITTRETVGVDG